jgi:AcrR family transcriptional regulator
MARPRVIEQHDILDAAEAVVLRNGAANLTLDAVALEAGISKASVVYDYKTKQQLIKAIIERRLALEEERICSATASLGCLPGAVIHGMIAAAATTPPDETRAVALNLTAAVAQDSALRKPIAEFYQEKISAVQETVKRGPRGGLLAFLALEGLKSLEWHDIHSWPDDERQRILREIAWLVDADPSPEEPATPPFLLTN